MGKIVKFLVTVSISILSACANNVVEEIIPTKHDYENVSASMIANYEISGDGFSTKATNVSEISENNAVYSKVDESKILRLKIDFVNKKGELVSKLEPSESPLTREKRLVKMPLLFVKNSLAKISVDVFNSDSSKFASAYQEVFINRENMIVNVNLKKVIETVSGMVVINIPE